MTKWVKTQTQQTLHFLVYYFSLLTPLVIKANQWEHYHLFINFFPSPSRVWSPSKDHKQPLISESAYTLLIQASFPEDLSVGEVDVSYTGGHPMSTSFQCITVFCPDSSLRNERLFVFINMSLLGNQCMITRYHTERHTLTSTHRTCPAVMDPAVFEYMKYVYACSMRIYCFLAGYDRFSESQTHLKGRVVWFPKSW